MYINSLYVFLWPTLDLKWRTMVKAYFPMPWVLGNKGFTDYHRQSHRQRYSSLPWERSPHNKSTITIKSNFNINRSIYKLKSTFNNIITSKLIFNNKYIQQTSKIKQCDNKYYLKFNFYSSILILITFQLCKLFKQHNNLKLTFRLNNN